MPAKRTAMPPTAASIASYVERNAAHVKQTQQHRHHAADSLREATYQGHHIVVRTHYEIEVDGRSLIGHMGVTNDGHVHYHPVPNMSFASAIDLVKELINIFPDDFTKKTSRRKRGARRKK
ncbi:MAG: hypothetical protein R3B37_06605 [Nitrospira sp.]|nr:hypothetical protein [Nitrospira sp.]